MRGHFQIPYVLFSHEKPNTDESKTDGGSAEGEEVGTNTDGSGAEGEEVGTNADGSGAEREEVGTKTDEENGRSWIKRFHPAYPRKTVGSLSVLFLVAIVLAMLFYALFHNRRKVSIFSKSCLINCCVFVSC